MAFMTNVAILGAGKIARKMAETINLMSKDSRWEGQVNLYAVATRDSIERAEQFAREFEIDVAYGSYQEMLDDPDVDMVYIATPHTLHASQAIMCMEAGKHVLVEKPLAINATQAQAVFEKSRETGLTCGEAIWTRYEPSRRIIQDIIDSGIIGEITSMSANLSYPMMAKERIIKPELAGGALLDVGIYPLNFVSMFMPGGVSRIVSSARLSEQGTDELSQTTLWYDDGKMADITTSYWEVGDRCGMIRGTEGIIRVENANNPEEIRVLNRSYETISNPEIPHQLTGFEYEVDEMLTAISQGNVEPVSMPHDETMRMMSLMDKIREQWGLKYPDEM
ncbi:Gfo/Idh/MocA family oxidoreductase [Alloscardovia theropitheci]|uniref:Gfo/Idh/MocA family oxidoreductase n=1 Tax=Alloscardovia theropitheci TaxID=2496842 RepID=A0A4R0QU42_9BIFI|nr:Gfo/Idh/MocA family oxidoreductase [Alloscardovia theropitheci]TCD55088.1 Gfo/Idh/MocA family oxidoreductase [Alloscardovia theropitheci]